MTLIPETERTKLRPLYASDFDNIKRMMTDPDIMKFTRFQVPQTDDAIKATLESWSKQHGPPLGVWCVEEKMTCDFIGWFMLRLIDSNVPELGYMIMPKHSSKGYATEVTKRLIHFALYELSYPRVIAVTDATNAASIRVLEKSGMRKVPDYKDPHQKKDMFLFEARKEQVGSTKDGD